ncbi:MAG: gliding motility-associated-like protein, partial [Saprospiraceae bacterium]
VLTVNTLPTVTVNDAEICTGGTAANFTAVSATATSYLWSINATGAGSTKTGTAAGDYKVIVTDINGCTATDTGVLTVNILPVAAVTSTGICIGDPAASFTASADSAIASYLWSENGAGTNSTTSGTAAGNYTVQITDIHGCVDSETGVLTVNPLPVVGNTPKVLCTGDPAVIVGEVVSGGPYNYSWVETGESTATISVTVGNMTYNRNVENIATGCKASSGYLVTENVNPSVNVDDDTKCTGDAMTLFDTFSSVGYSYIWDPGQIPTATIQPTSNQIYTITKINDATGCSNTTTGRATFVAIPNASIAPDTVTVCQGDPASLFVTHDATSLQWSDGSNTDYTSVFTQGMYTAVASNGGCPAKDSVYVKVIEYPVSQLSKAIEGELICFEELDRVLTLTAHTNENLTYLWGAGETTSTIAVEAKGTYNVSISNGSCTIEDLVTIYTYCPWTLFVPNAFSPEGPGGNLNNTFSAKGTNIVEFVMTVYDRWGLKIYETKDLHNGWDGTYKSHLVQSDVYVWKINFSVESKTGNLSDHSRVGTVTVVR